MEGGRRRRVAWVAGLLLGLVALVVALAPLILRGPVLRWAVARATRPLCGNFELGNGRLGWTFVPNLVLQRSFTIELEDAHIQTPDGSEIIAVERVSARVAVERNPWRVTVDDAVATNGRWRLAMGGPPGAGFVDAFRPVPEGGSRAACREPRARTRGRRAAGAGFGGIVVRDLHLVEVDANLDFPAWGLVLPRVRAHGSLAVAVPGSAGILFDARDAKSPGGALRVGPVGSRGMTRAPFDDVEIARVTVEPEHPTDLALTVAHARTGRSSLSGTARFNNIFPPPGPRRARPPAGMTMDARWTDTSDVEARLEAAWLPPATTLKEIGVGGLIVAHLDGPFKALSGAVTADGPRGHLEATLEGARRASADVRAKGIAVPMLKSRATGRLRAHLEIAPSLAELDVVIDEADLTLARLEDAEGPRRFALRVGPRPRGARGREPLSTADTLSVGLERARLHAGALTLDGARVRWAGVTAGGHLDVTLSPSAPGDLAAARIDAAIDVAVTSTARWVAPTKLDARGTASARVTGSVDQLRARVTFGPTTRIAILGEPFHAPPEITAVVDGRRLTVPELRLTHEGGGSVAARIRADMGRNVGGHLELRDYPISRVPGFADIRPPLVLGAPEGASLADVMEGTLDATFDVRGRVSRPSATGTATLTGVRVAGRPIDDGRFTVRLMPLHAKIEGTLGPTVSVAGEGHVGKGGPAATANVSMHGFALSPWLPHPLDQLVSSVTGDTRISVEPGRNPRARFALGLTGPAGELAVDGTVTKSTMDGTVRGLMDIAGLRPLWAPFLARADGAADVDLRLQLDFEHPALDHVAGTVVLTRALRAQPVRVPLALEVAAGGRIAIDNLELRTEGLVLTTAGARAQVRGEARLQPRALGYSTLAVAATGELDVGALARQAALPQLASASGRATFEARVDGEARAPAVAGRVTLAAVALRTTRPGWPPLRFDGTVEASGHTLRTRGLRIETNPLGALTIGGPETPASLELLSLDPPRLGHVDVTVAGRALHFGDASTSLQIGALDLALRLAGDQRAMELRGDVGIGRARFDAARGKPAKAGPSRPWYESLPPHLALDLTLHGAADALSVDVPVLPDVSLGFACHVSASARGASLSGHLRGSTVYSRMALAIYDWIKPQDVRACRVLKEQ